MERETLAAIERSRGKKKHGSRVGISPLELVTQAFLLVVVGEYCELDTSEVKQVVQRCDNASCVAVVASRRPKSPAMEVALCIVEEVETAYGLSLALDHIGTDVNVVADAMSHNDLAKAKSALQVLGKDLVECDRSMKVCIGSFVGTFEAFARVAETRVRDALTAADMVLV